MDQEQNNTAGGTVLPPATTGADKNSNSMMGIAVLVIVLLVALAWYFVGQNQDTVMPMPGMMEESSMEIANPEVPAVDEATVSLEAQGSTDDVSSIEADLNATDLDSLGDINNI